MGQLLSSAEELSQLKDALASVLYEAMLGAGAGPDLRVVHPLMLANQDECFASQVGLMEQLQQVNRFCETLRLQCGCCCREGRQVFAERGRVGGNHPPEVQMEIIRRAGRTQFP